MAVTKTIPDWVVPTVQHLHDVHWLAYWQMNYRASTWAAGIGAALAWVVDGDPAPITGRTEQPVTHALAQAEQAAAWTVGDPAYPLRAQYARLDVTPVMPQTGDVKWAQGVEDTLRWLRGITSKPPLPVPVRHPDGHSMTTAELYNIAVQLRPHSYALPEQRQALCTRVAREATLSANLAALIDEAKHQLAPSAS